MNLIDYHLEFGSLIPRRDTKRLVIHHSASADISAVEIHRWHQKRGWSGIGYHYVIRRNGDVELGRPVNMIGAHALGYNLDSIGVCLTGNFSKETPEKEQLNALVELTHELELQFGRLEIQQHNQLVATQCPGSHFPWDELMTKLKEVPPVEEQWKKKIMNEAKAAGLITEEHNPDDPAPKWFVLAVGLNILKKLESK